MTDAPTAETPQAPSPETTERDSMTYDVVIIGAGPAGLSAAIRLKQLAQENGTETSVCILEKGSEVGAHLLSGAAFETRALDELIPDWKDKGAPLSVPAKKDKFLYLTKTGSFRLPTPPQMHNKGNYIISLGIFARWLAQQAEAMGIEIYPGFAAAEILYSEDGAVRGVATGDMGINKDGTPGPNFQRGMELHARQVIFAEGCRGSLSQLLMDKFDLRKNCDPQTYAIGIKEIWQVDPAKHEEGSITHTVGWPMESKTYGGSFIYHAGENQVYIGYVIGLDYTNPHLYPFEEMQRFKLHPKIRPLLEGGKRLSYGARALSEGGLQSLPKLTFPGGVLVGDAAGFLNVPKIKGNHAAMKSGMLAAEAVFETLQSDSNEATSYPQKFEASWLYKELKKVRNIRPGFHKGLWFGIIYGALETITFGKLPWTLKNKADHTQLKKAAECPKIDYPKPDGVITFDRLSSVFVSNTNHEENQPSHLKLKDPSIPIDQNLPEFDEPAQRYCPAGVYEVVEDDQGGKRFQINAQNCVHCKTCDIKDPHQNIVWTVPQGGGGPNYSNM